MLQSLKGPTGQVRHVAWTDLNRTLISAGQDGIVRRWDVEVHTPPPSRSPMLYHRSLTHVLIRHGKI